MCFPPSGWCWEDSERGSEPDLMPRKLVLAEKPSVARKIAGAIGGRFKNHEGFIEVGDWAVTWALGHLFEIDDSIAPKRWELASLPIFPERFRYTFRDDDARRQFRVIKKLLSQAEEVYVFTDMGREGENIARLILIHAGWKKWDRTYRPWTSDALSPGVIKKLLSRKDPISRFDSLFWAAQARQHADWIVGINLSRAATLTSPNGSGVWSVGRVQTPTLKLIVDRDREIENFRPETFFLVRVRFEKDGIEFEGKLRVPRDDREERGAEKEKGFRIWKKEDLDRILSALSGIREGEVLFVDAKKKSAPPPSFHSLTTLQREANRLFGFSAHRTHELAQRLYERDLITYPRTESTVLAENEVGKVAGILRALGYANLAGEAFRAGKRLFDNERLDDDHGAIIPLKPPPADLSGDELKVYRLIARRFVAAFMPPHLYEVTRVEIRLGSFAAVVEGRRDLDLGWRRLYRKEEREVVLPALKPGDAVRVIGVRPEEKKTSPPPRYTEDLLLERMKALGLGRPSTRDGIIETLVRRGYCERRGKKLMSTKKGRTLIDRLSSRRIVSPEITGEWERELDRIWTRKLGRRGYEEFIRKIRDFVRDEIRAVCAKP